MKSATILVALSLSGCVSMADVKERAPLVNEEVKGNYSALARCVADSMQTHERWGIRAAQYNVRIYPDIERAEVQSSASSGLTGTIYGFLLELRKIDQDNSHATLRGIYDDVNEAKKTLQSCSQKV